MPPAAQRVELPQAPDPLRVYFRFLRLHRRVGSAIARELKALGLSIPQFDLLSTLSEREATTQQELAERLYVTKGHVSGLVDRLVVDAARRKARTSLRCEIALVQGFL